MSSDFLASLIIFGLAGLILHWKSHLKFIVLGLFVGLVLAQTLADPIYDYLTERFGGLNRPGALNSLQLLLLLIPTFVLGINHLSERRKLGLAKMLVYAGITTLLLLSSILKFLPDNLQFALTSRSIIAFQLLQFHLWLLVFGAGLVIFDSFYHRGLRVKKGKKPKDK